MTPRAERWCVGALAVFAALRLLALAWTFPVFNNIDEILHYDVIFKYGQGRLPEPDDFPMDPLIVRTFLLWGSPEYGSQDAVPLEPAGVRPGAVRTPEFQAALARFRNYSHQQNVQPPVYYTLAAIWWRLGRACGLQDPLLAYWTRALGAVFAFMLVLVSYRILQRTHADDSLVRVGVPLLLAVYPQDAWFSLTNDTLSPLLFTVSFGFLCSLRTTGEIAPRRLLLGGLAMALTFLVKYTNLGIVVVALAAWLLRWRETSHGRSLSAGHGEWLRAAVFWGAAAVPVAAWFGRNLVVMGDPTGMSVMTEWAGTSFKPPGQLFDHPIFGLDGAAHFFSLLAASFWRGEYFWHGARLSHAGVDLLYQIGTLVAVGAAALRLAMASGSNRARRAETLALLAVAAAILTLVGLSITQEFPEGGVVSNREPYIFFGRYVTGVTVPFLILFARGVGVLGGSFPERFRSPASWGLLFAVAATALVSEAMLTAPVLASPFNAFGLLPDGSASQRT